MLICTLESSGMDTIVYMLICTLVSGYIDSCIYVNMYIGVWWFGQLYLC